MTSSRLEALREQVRVLEEHYVNINFVVPEVGL